MSAPNNPEQGPVNADLQAGEGKEGHSFPKVLILGWVVFLVWLVAYVVMNIDKGWS